MSQGGYITLVGFVAREPSFRYTKDGRPVTGVRVGATTRVFDRETGEWRDTDSSYFTVNCWRGLALAAKASLRKGDPVIVKGRFRTRTYEDKESRMRTEVEIIADTIGHDLSRGGGYAVYARYRNQPERGDLEREGESQERAETPDDAGSAPGARDGAAADPPTGAGRADGDSTRDDEHDEGPDAHDEDPGDDGAPGDVSYIDGEAAAELAAALSEDDSPAAGWLA